MAREYTIYRLSDGTILRTYRGDAPELQVAADVDGYIEGAFSALCHRVNTVTKEVERFTPVAKSGAEWSEALRSFVPTVAARKQHAARSQIETLERQQARAIREQALGRGGTPAQLRKRLEDIDDAIIELRKDL